eukprot:scaffold3880_cov145-Skeletonema_menzelii.AAC.3
MMVSISTWTGTNDIALIEDQIRRLFQDENRTVYLLWTGGAGATTATTTSSSSEESAESYIIIDGTWQQAKKIYRKVSILWSLPRISFHGKDVPHSKYVLRGDYSGWRDRFGIAPFLHMKVPGLCIGGGGVTLGNKEEGHVFFMRKEEGADLVPTRNAAALKIRFNVLGRTKIPFLIGFSLGCCLPLRLLLRGFLFAEIIF